MENNKNPLRKVQYPDHTRVESATDRSLMLLSPVISASISVEDYVFKKLIELRVHHKNTRDHTSLDQMVASRHPNFSEKLSEQRDYNLWIGNQIRYHLVHDYGRAIFLCIPRHIGNIPNPTKGYAKHTSFELGLIAGARMHSKVNIVVCMEKGVSEEQYYRDTLEVLCPGLHIHSNIDEAIEEVYLMVTHDPVRLQEVSA